MKKPRRLRVFKVYISYFEEGKRSIYILENCINVKGRVAQIYKWRIRPIFVNLDKQQKELVFTELKKSKGSITATNYQFFLPYMAKFSHDPKALVIDLDSSHGIYLGYLHMHKARLV